jgi:glutamine amidotransferase
MIDPKIVIVDYGLGNTHSVANALRYLGYKKLQITADFKLIECADALILPGVGAFETCASNLRARGLEPLLNDVVLRQKRPILGICVGMQLMATTGQENGIHQGLNWIPGVVKRLELPVNYSVPHVGWNNVGYASRSPLFDRIEQGANYYFDHSYTFVCDEQYAAATTEYGISIVAVVQHENIVGVQFHPEKSQVNGLKLFRSFFNSI